MAGQNACPYAKGIETFATVMVLSRLVLRKKDRPYVKGIETSGLYHLPSLLPNG